MTTVKEQVINESISRIEKRIKEINDILEARPLQDIIKLREKVYPKIQAQKDVTDPDFIKMVKKAANEEKRLFALAKKQSEGTIKYIDERIELETELQELKNELFYINMRKQQRVS